MIISLKEKSNTELLDILKQRKVKFSSYRINAASNPVETESKNIEETIAKIKENVRRIKVKQEQKTTIEKIVAGKEIVKKEILDEEAIEEEVIVKAEVSQPELSTTTSDDILNEKILDKDLFIEREEEVAVLAEDDEKSDEIKAKKSSKVNNDSTKTINQRMKVGFFGRRSRR